MVYLLTTSGKFSLRTAVDNSSLCTQTLCRTHSIHRNVTTTNNNYTLTDINRCIILIIVRTHQVSTGQKLVCRNNAVQVLALDTHKTWKTSSRADKDSRETLLVQQRIDGNSTTYDNIRLKLYAQTTHIVNLTSNNLLLRQTELWNTIHQHSAQLVQSLEYRNLITHLRQVAGTSQARRTATDNSYLLTIGSNLNTTLTLVLKAPIANKTLQLTDSHRLALNTEDTRALALCLLRTHTTTDARQ